MTQHSSRKIVDKLPFELQDVDEETKLHMLSHKDPEAHIAKTDYSGNDQALHEQSLGWFFFNGMKKFSNNIIQYIADTDEVDTYGDLLTRCIRTALKLKEKGITKNDIVSSCTENHKNCCVPFIATQLIGAKTTTFDPNLPPLETIHLLKLTQPKIMFISTGLLPLMVRCLQEAKVETELVVFGKSKDYYEFHEFQETNSDEENFKPSSIDNSKETALIQFSSGTTGFPKGICLSHYSLLEQTTNTSIFSYNGKSQTVLLMYATYYWISAVASLIQNVTEGGARVVCSKFDAVNTWKLIEKYKVTYIFLPPYQAHEFLAQRPENTDVSSLGVFATSGCPVTCQLMKDLKQALPNTIIIQGYGQTEVGGVITHFDVTNPNELELQNRKPQSCGKIRSRLDWKVVDPDSEKVVGPHQRGEVRIKSDFLMNGYYKMDSSSEFDSEGYFKTGDIAYYDEEMCFYLVDRIKEMFKFRGWQILPAVLEEVLLSHPAVKEAVVIGIPHEMDGERPMGLVVLDNGYKNVTPKDIELFVKEKVADTQRLRAGIKFVNEIIRTGTGKLRRKVMRNLALNHEI